MKAAGVVMVALSASEPGFAPITSEATMPLTPGRSNRSGTDRNRMATNRAPSKIPAILFVAAVAASPVYALVRAIATGDGASEGAIVILTLAACAVTLWVVSALVSWGGRIRNAAILRSHPAALLIDAHRSAELKRTVKTLGLSSVKIRPWIVWAVDETGVGLWQGRSNPVRAFHLPWVSILDVQVTYVSEGKNSFPALAFIIADDAGEEHRLAFPVASRKRILFAATRAGVSEAGAALMERAPQPAA